MTDHILHLNIGYFKISYKNSSKNLFDQFKFLEGSLHDFACQLMEALRQTVSSLHPSAIDVQINQWQMHIFQAKICMVKNHT